MPLIIEDGSIVPNANSFTTDAEFVAYADARGFTLPVDEGDRDSLQILAMDYLFSVEHKLDGCRVSIDQELMYPRRGACVNGFNIPSDSIPNSIKNAQMELAYQASTSALLINATNQNIQREKLDTLEVAYFSGGSWEQVNTGRADAYLNPLYINGGNSNIMGRV
jgi:hypothetical protein